MTIDPISMAPIYNSLHRHTGTILEQDEAGILVADAPGQVLMLWHEQKESGRQWLARHLPDHPNYMVLTMQTGMGPFLKETLPLSSMKTCTQFVLPPAGTLPAGADGPAGVSMEEGQELDPAHVPPLPAADLSLQVRPAQIADLSYLKKHYTLCSEQALLSAIQEERLFLFLLPDGRTVGFAGEHPEGAMGFLTIEPAFRRQGYARQIEQWLIGLEQQRGLVPYCHVFEDNAPSMALQRQLRLHPCRQKIEWMWQL